MQDEQDMELREDPRAPTSLVHTGSQFVRDLFDQALTRPPTEWSSFVAEACEDEPARTVLLDLLGQIEDQLPARVAGSSRPGAVLGRRYGPYRVLRQIGQGGMGAVYLAVKVDGTFVRRVALKILPAASFGSSTAPAFEREQSIMAGLEHPGIARLYDAGTVDGEAYLAMEYVEGEFVDVYCAKRGLGLRERLRLFLKVCTAVAYAHRNLVVHRDLKPANILVAEDGEPRLLDFGIAKLLDQGDATATLGPRALTPAYASPEQLRSLRVNTVSDVFSLGALLHLLITGEEPFPRSLEERVAMLEFGEAPRSPSSYFATTSAGAGLISGREIDGDLDAIVLKALREDPDERFSSVQELAEDIERFLDGQPVTARRQSAIDRTRKFVRRHRAAVVGSLATGLALLVAVVTMALMTLRVSAERTKVELQRDRAERVTEFLADVFELSNPEVAQGEEPTVRQVLDRAAESLPQELENEPEVRAALLSVLGNVYGHLGLHERSRELLSTALDQQLALLGPGDPQTLDTQLLLASALNEQGDFEGAIELRELVLEVQERRLGAPHPAMVQNLAGLAISYFRLEQIERAEALIDRGIAMADTLGSIPATELGSLYHLRANLLLAAGSYERAAEDYAAAISELGESLGDDDVQLTGLMKDRARALIELDRLPQAEEILHHALRIERTVYPDGHPKTAFTLSGLALLYEEQGDFERSEPLAREAVEIRTRLLGARHPATAVALVRLAGSLKGQGRNDESAAFYRESLDIWSAAMGADHPRLAHHHVALAELAREKADLAAASDHLDRAGRVQAHLDATHPDRLMVDFERAHLLAAQDRTAEALALLDQLRGRTESKRLLGRLDDLAGELSLAHRTMTGT